MKKYRPLIFLIVLASIGLARAGMDLVPRAFIMTGRWQPSEDPLMVDDYGFQDVQNVRKWGKYWRGVKGQTAINSSQTYTLTTAQDYTAYTEVDGPARITAISNALSISKVDEDEECYVYDNKGFGHFAYNFTYDFDLYVSSTDSVHGSEVYIWGISNKIDDLYNTSDCIRLWAQYWTIGGNVVRLVLREIKNGSIVAYNSSGFVLSVNTNWYFRIERKQNVIYTTVFSDSSRQIVLQGPKSLNLLYPDNINNFRYLYAFSSRNDGSAGLEWSGSISNLTEKHGIDNAFHFKKDSPSKESHVLLQTDYLIYRNNTAIPDAGPFTETIYNNPDDYQLGRFSPAPQGSMLYANGAETCIWGGNEIYPISFITSTAAIGYTVVNANDYTDQVTNSLQTADNIARIGGVNDASTVLLMHFDGADGATTTTDSSASAHTGTAYGAAALDTDFQKFGTASLKLTGAADYIAYSDSVDWNFGSNPFTIETWVFLDGAPTSTLYFYDHYEGVANYARLFYNPGGTLALNVYSGAPIILISNAWSPSVGRWYHFALTKDGSNDYRMFIDGSQIGTTQSDASAYTTGSTTSVDLKIGTGITNGIHLDEYRISKGVARYTSNFTPPDRAYSGDNSYWLLGSPRPIQGAKFYIANANPSAASVTVQEWAGAAWNSLTPVVDNTSGLSVTGTITWPSTVETAEKRYIEGLSLYWYQFHVSAGQADIYQVTLDAPFQPITNIWNGSETTVAGCKVYTNTIQDYTDEVNDDTTVFAAILDDLPTTGYLMIGFTQPMQGINFRVTASKENSNVATATPYFWNGESWETLLAFSDGTGYSGAGTISLSNSGVMVWKAPDPGTEFPKQEANKYPLYWYKITWSATLDSEVEVYQITGVPAPRDVDQDQVFAAMFQNRAFLFKKNYATYSSYNAPYIFNGIDSGYIFFGSDLPVTAAATIYNVFQTTGFEQLIVTKKNETYRVVGDGPDNWSLTQMSGNVGCVAPLTMAVCEITDISQQVRRHVAIWQYNSGIVMSDGATIAPISEDIRCYWDSTDSRYIPTNRQDDSVGWYDSRLGVYKLLVSSGSGQTTHNVELEYSLKTQEWTKLYRENGSGANPLQVGIQVHDTDGAAYSYGFSDDGYMYRLENGKTWNGTAIDQYLWTKDMLWDTEIPFWRKTTARYFRIMNKAKAGGENINIGHYCDDTLTTMAAGSNTYTITAHSMANQYTTQSCVMGPCLKHSFKFSADVSAVDDGMEVTGFGVLYTPEPSLTR